MSVAIGPVPQEFRPQEISPPRNIAPFRKFAPLYKFLIFSLKTKRSQVENSIEKCDLFITIRRQNYKDILG
jgi:hypothetical protein